MFELIRERLPFCDARLDSAARETMFRDAESDDRPFSELMRPTPPRFGGWRGTRSAGRIATTCSDIFLAVWRALPGFRGESSVRTWLYRIAHNVALTWQTRDRRRLSREAPFDDDVIDVAVAAHVVDLRRLALKRAIAGMNATDRTLTLLWLEACLRGDLGFTASCRDRRRRRGRIRKQLPRLMPSHRNDDLFPPSDVDSPSTGGL